MAESEELSAQPTWADLYDYRARVARLYRQREAAYRRGDDERETLERFRAARDTLFARHPQSALTAEERASFSGLRYFPYAPELRVGAVLTPLAPEPREADGAEAQIEASGPHTMRFARAARVNFVLGETPAELTIYWLDVYGGGLFLAFRDATCPDESYGGGRYLFDTVKGSDFIRLDADDAGDADESGGRMGYFGGRIVLDFNYAYNPSCAYNPRWVCPLAPRENRLSAPIRAGERKYHE